MDIHNVNGDARNQSCTFSPFFTKSWGQNFGKNGEMIKKIPFLYPAFHLPTSQIIPIDFL